MTDKDRIILIDDVFTTGATSIHVRGPSDQGFNQVSIADIGTRRNKQVNMAFFTKPKYSTVNVKSRDGSQGRVGLSVHIQQIWFLPKLKKNLMVVPSSGYHFPLPAPDRIESLLDKDSFQEFDKDLRSSDPLLWGVSSYKEKLEQNRENKWRIQD